MNFEHTETFGWETALRGLRNPAQSYAKADSHWEEIPFSSDKEFVIGPNDKDLALRMTRNGSPHNKFARQIFVGVDITAPMYWHKEMDTYRAGVEKDSCSTMYRMMSKPFTADDFEADPEEPWMDFTLDMLNMLREAYLQTTEKKWWYSAIKYLPMAYRQKRTFTFSYAALKEICEQRKGHKLDEWRQFIDWCHSLPNSWLIFGEEAEGSHK